MNITKVYLLDVPLEKDYKNTLYFDNATSQYNYFYGKRVKTYTDFTYQRKDKFIRVPDDYDDIKNCNYVMYQNTGKTNKWYYAFIEKMEYVSDGRTDIYISTDVMQTYAFDYEIKPSFIEREHVDDDTLGLHTLPENLELGEYTSTSSLIDSYNDDLCIIMGTTVDPVAAQNTAGGIYTGIPSGICYFRYDQVGNRTSTDNVNDLNGAINYLNTAGRIEGLQSLFLAPKWLVPMVAPPYVAPNNSVQTQTLGISRISSLDGYEPHNKKLLTFPYCYIEMSNNVGQATTFMQERWRLSSGEMKVKMVGCLTSGCSIRCYPKNYNGVEEALDYGITLGKFPSIAWINDHYTNWLTQNGINLGSVKLNAVEARRVSAAAEAIGGGLMLGTGNIAGGAVQIGSSLRSVFDTMQETYQHELVPNTVSGNINSGDVTTAMRANRLVCYKKTIKQEYAEIIDRYFDTYGYKVNTVKVPNKNHRANWWYTKTISCNIIGAIPNEDLDKIKSCYNAGITFWKNPATIYDYSQSNAIIS